MTTRCELYGDIHNETLAAADCPLFTDDLDKS